jgi:succinoglycan biosynthesis protein ExoW
MTPADSEPRAGPRIGVVIPYFQRDAGLLQRALSSVAAQEYRPAQVVVVDDGSPRAAADEITPALYEALPGLTVIRQENQGVAAARNTALDAIAADISAVALLDSDDCWEPSHLRNAATALSRGGDFFFSNSRTEGETTDYFHAHSRREVLYNSPPVEGAPGILRWTAGVSALFGAGCAFATATVVFRRAVMPELRFSTKFRRAGEDQLAFWELLVRSSIIMFCTRPTLIYGSAGLGTWRKATHGSVSHLVRLADEIRLRRQVIASYPLSADDRQLMLRAIAERRVTALYSALHLLKLRRNTFKEVLYLFRSDPMCALSWCVDLPKLLYRRIRNVPTTP